MKNNSKLRTLTEDSIVELAKAIRKQVLLSVTLQDTFTRLNQVSDAQISILENLKAALDAAPKKKPAKAVKPKRVSKVASKVPKK